MIYYLLLYINIFARDILSHNVNKMLGFFPVYLIYSLLKQDALCI